MGVPGAPGTTADIISNEGEDASPLPTAFTAWTVKRYPLPVVRPEIVKLGIVLVPA